MNLEERLIYQRKEKVFNLFKVVTNNVPFYFDYVNSSFETIPIVNKNLIRNNYDFFLNSNIDIKSREKILEVLHDKSIVRTQSYNELAMLDSVIFEETTGTSGVPFRVVKAKAERTQMGLQLWKIRRKIDKCISLRNIYLFNHTGLHEFNPDIYNYNQEHIENIYEDVILKKSRWIHTSIVPLKKHIEILRQSGKQLAFPDLKYIELTGNYLHKSEVEMVEDFFQVKILNMYGSIETWQIAYSRYGEYLKVCDENIFLEIIDDNGIAITDTNKIGNIVVTCLQLFLMPLIRYNTGDRGSYVYNKNDDTIYIELQEEREINLIKGISEKKIGSKQFGNILTMIKRKYNLKDIDYIQFVQSEIDTILIYVNYFSDLNIVMKEIFEVTKKRLNREFRFEVCILSEKEIAQRKYEKDNLFICKC